MNGKCEINLWIGQSQTGLKNGWNWPKIAWAKPSKEYFEIEIGGVRSHFSKLRFQIGRATISAKAVIDAALFFC